MWRDVRLERLGIPDFAHESGKAKWELWCGGQGVRCQGWREEKEVSDRGYVGKRLHNDVEIVVGLDIIHAQEA